MVSAAAQRPWLYVEQILCHLEQERIDPARLRAAFQTLVDQTPVLSWVISTQGPGRPRQRPALPGEVPLDVLDWSDRPRAQQEVALQTLLAEDRNRGIALSASPCFRLTLILTGPASSKLLWTLPHALLDGRSFAPLLAQAFDIYAAPTAGTAPAAPELPDQFAEHCRALSKADHSAGKAHFARLLDGWEGETGLIDIAAAPGRKTSVRHELSLEETETLVALAARAGVTLSSLVAAAWGMVLARTTGRADAVFGLTLSGRHLVPHSGAAPGCFIVTVPFRVRLQRSLTLGALLGRVRKDQIGLRPHEQTPLADLRGVAHVPPDQPLLESTLMFDTATLDQRMQAFGGAWHGRRVDLLEEDDMPLTVAAYQGDRLRLEVEYDPQQAPKGPVLAAHLKTLLGAFATATPDTRLADLSMLSSDAEQALIALSGSTASPPEGRDNCLTRFEQQAARSAAQPALSMIAQEGPLSYGALDAAANALAQDLIAQGTAPGDVIGICAGRDPVFVLAILAVWKAGAAFVPMDPTYPEETLRIMAEDSGARCILTGPDAPPFALPCLPLGPERRTARQAQAPERPGPDRAATAYILFTSGTTGRPKGVVISHGALAAHATAATQLFDLAPADRVLQFASLSFDVAIEEIIPTLLAGAHLVLRSPEMSQSVSAFLDYCRRAGITLLNLPTGFWVELSHALESDAAPLPATLRLMVVGGERVPLSALQRWRAHAPGLRWINGYGPTETTITCTAFELKQEDDLKVSVPIGRPLSHAHAWVLAADGTLAPEGAPGELCIAGPAVAQGYVVQDPARSTGFQELTQGPLRGRSYRTGDRVFWQGGQLHFLGRMDRQAKIRGFRVDPGQIESLLEARRDVARAHVAVLKRGQLRGSLVAWYAASETSAPPAPADIDSYLSENLPSYMQPLVVEVPVWPLTAGGKTDVAALPQPRAAAPRPAAAPAEISARTRSIAELFEAVLDCGAVAPDASFFDLGGNSLSLLRLNSLLEQRYKFALTPTLLYKDPTPAGIAALLDADEIDRSLVIPLQPNGSGAPLYAVHALGDNNCFFRHLAEAMAPDQPLFGVTIGIRKEGLPQTVEALGRFYRDQIMRHQPQGPLSLVAVSVSSFITFELAQQLLAAGRDVRALVFLDASGPDGRARRGRMGHRWVHLQNLLREGRPYLRRLRAERRGERQHKEAMARMAQAGTSPDSAPKKITSVADFVASSELAIAKYTPAPYPRRITIFRAEDPFDSAAARSNGLGWQSVAAGGFDLINVSGGHITMLYPPHVEGLAQRMRDVL